MRRIESRAEYEAIAAEKVEEVKAKENNEREDERRKEENELKDVVQILELEREEGQENKIEKNKRPLLKRECTKMRVLFPERIETEDLL